VASPKNVKEAIEAVEERTMHIRCGHHIDYISRHRNGLTTFERIHMPPRHCQCPEPKYDPCTHKPA
jgi:hypothetical protein